MKVISRHHRDTNIQYTSLLLEQKDLLWLEWRQLSDISGMSHQSPYRILMLTCLDVGKFATLPLLGVDCHALLSGFRKRMFFRQFSPFLRETRSLGIAVTVMTKPVEKLPFHDSYYRHFGRRCLSSAESRAIPSFRHNCPQMPNVLSACNLHG